MNPERIGLTFVVILFVVMLVQLEVGRRIRARHLAAGEPGGLGAIEGALFGLLGLLLAFTFSGAAGRFDTRRQQIVEEANAIGTAYLRLDVLPASSAAEGVVPQAVLLEEALGQLARRYRLVVVDLPPLEDPALAATIAPLLDGVLLVLEAVRARGDDAEKAIRRVENSGGRLLGIVLNKER